ncbi:TPA: hypothetical protein DDZ06_01510 [Candidatus Uhrbacteria bacterium]|nr:hypothetical protein [Candidatus Uhrbacteria bacterium]
MSEHSFMPPGFEDDPSIIQHQVEIPQPETPSFLSEADIIERFFNRGLFEERAYERRHPFGADMEDDAVRQKKITMAQGMLSRMQSTPGFKWLVRGLLGAGIMLSSGETSSGDAQASVTKEQTQASEMAEDPGVQYELRRLLLEDLEREGRVFGEMDARFGPSDLSSEEAQEYGSRFHDLSAMFEFLHRNDTELMKTYHDPRSRIENYETLAGLIGKEFIHSKLLWIFTNETSDMALELLPTLPEKEACVVYTQLYAQMTHRVGMRTPYEMSRHLLKNLEEDHELAKLIRDQKLADPQMEKWFQKSSQNHAYFDQATGRLEIMRKLSTKEKTTVQSSLSLLDPEQDYILLLDSAPANGGDPNAPSFYDSKTAHQEVRTPDGVFPYLETVRKKSPSWQYSWIADGSPLRLSEDKKNVEYQDLDGKWYQATGEEAVFFGDQRPFKDKKRSWIYNSAGRMEEGTFTPPSPFTLPDFMVTRDVVSGTSVLGLAEQWEKNEFGPLTIHVKDPKKGKRASFMYHSSPSDETPWSFLNHSHGCVHMKPEDIQLLDGYLSKGSTIRNSSAVLS